MRPRTEVLRVQRRQQRGAETYPSPLELRRDVCGYRAESLNVGDRNPEGATTDPGDKAVIFLDAGGVRALNLVVAPYVFVVLVWVRPSRRRRSATPVHAAGEPARDECENTDKSSDQCARDCAQQLSGITKFYQTPSKTLMIEHSVMGTEHA